MPTSRRELQAHALNALKNAIAEADDALGDILAGDLASDTGMDAAIGGINMLNDECDRIERTQLEALPVLEQASGEPSADLPAIRDRLHANARLALGNRGRNLAVLMGHMQSAIRQHGDLPGLHESLLTCAETAAARLRISTDELVEMSTKKDQRPAERAATHAAYVSWKHAQALHDRLITVKPWLERLAWFAGLDPNRSVTRARVFEMVDKAQAGLQKALSETEQGHPGRQGLVDASLRLEPYWRGLDPLIKAASRSDGAASNAFLSEAISQCRATLADVKTGVGWHRLSPPVEPVPVDPTG